VFEAQYETYDNIAYLQFILNNIDLGISTSEQVIEKGLAHGREIDGISLINNMNYAFNSWHEYETAEKLAEVLFRLNSKSDANVNSLVYFRYGQAQSNAGHYQEAVESLNIALENTSDTQLILGIEMARATAYAGIGKSEEAVKCLKEVTRLMEDEGLSLNGFEESKLRVLSLIAISENNAAKTAQLSNARLKSIVQTQLDRQSKGIQGLQANLENDKNRQTERETALMRETELKQSELEAKQRSNVFLMALAASLLIIAIFAIGFAVWRQKISKILETAAHDAEAGDRAKSQFLSVMSHELRTPLNGIIEIADILSEKGETKELRNYNKLILKSGENLLQLLSGILDMAQMESGKLSIVTAPTSIRQIIDGLYQSAKSDVDASKVQFTCFIAENVPDDLMLDSMRVKQSLSNLIANAVRFTEQGRIHIHTTMNEPDRKGVRELTMIVADTGRGITDEVKSKLFKPFVQADSTLTRTHDGAGIGLAVTRGLSRLMGGDVTMSSTAGRGSEFKMVVKTCIAREAEFDTQTNRPVFEVVPSVSTKIDFSPAVSIEKLRSDAAAKEKAQIKQDLYGAQQKPEPAPATDELAEPLDFSEENETDFETIGGVNQAPTARNVEPAPVEIPAPAENPRAGFSRNHVRSDATEIEPDQLSGLNILIVEDIEANQEILSSLLEPVGCAVSCALNGKIALEMMKTQTFDAVLMDIRMPVLDGIEATKAIRILPEPYCNTAIIALTADASAENNAECLAAGADVFLTKPVIVSELFSSIRFARRKQMRQKQQALSA
jgi:signal transduction histidine kinase/CheY-like chemotaxis protein